MMKKVLFTMAVIAMAVCTIAVYVANWGCLMNCLTAITDNFIQIFVVNCALAATAGVGYLYYRFLSKKR